MSLWATDESDCFSLIPLLVDTASPHRGHQLQALQATEADKGCEEKGLKQGLIGNSVGSEGSFTSRQGPRPSMSLGNMLLDGLGALIKRCRLHLSSIGAPLGNGSKRRPKIRGSVPVFGQEALAKAVVGIREIKEGMRSARGAASSRTLT